MVLAKKVSGESSSSVSLCPILLYLPKIIYDLQWYVQQKKQNVFAQLLKMPAVISSL